jgi:exocyst complex component 2
MLSQLESALGASVEGERKVRLLLCCRTALCAQIMQTLMGAVAGLDKTFFDGYVKPKATVVAAILREGILDKDMDWYDTPQPTGKPIPLPFLLPTLTSTLEKYDRICTWP